MLAVHLAIGLLLVMFTVGAGGIVFDFAVQENLELPAISQLTYDLHSITRDYWYLLLPLLLCIDAALLTAVTAFFRRRTWLGSFWNTVVLVAAILYLFLVAVGMIVPLSQLIREEGAGDQARSRVFSTSHVL